MEITWTIENTEYTLHTRAILTAHWRVYASDGDMRVDAYGSQSFQANTDAENFIPLESVTQEDVVSWVKTSINAGNTAVEGETAMTKVELIEAGLINQLSKLVAPTTAAGLPWETA